ncbi:MAG: septum formation initiator family protein [Desulfobulbaceae bacterium]|nr:septum formation initiator family protein [Desulfobulbaceae bacterium]
MIHRKQNGLTLSELRLVKRVVLLLGIAGILWFIFAPGRGYFHYHRVQKQVEALARENRSLAEQNAELRKEIERLQNDDAYLEELARKKYGMLRENETIYEYRPSGKKN